MANVEKVRAAVRMLLPQADITLVDYLAEKASQELGGSGRPKGARRRSMNIEVERIIKREEMIELGLK